MGVDDGKCLGNGCKYFAGKPDAICFHAGFLPKCSPELKRERMIEMGNIIIIEWEGYSDKHIIMVGSNAWSGTCLTHYENVSESKRCSHFPPQSAMWLDLWRMQQRISRKQR
jgi:hypothetical protein